MIGHSEEEGEEGLRGKGSARGGQETESEKGGGEKKERECVERPGLEDEFLKPL